MTTLMRFGAALLLCLSLSIGFTQPHSSAAAAPEQPDKPVQVFDVAAGRVVKTIPNDDEFQSQAQSWLESVTGLAPQLQTDDSCSYVYRVPLKQPVNLSVQATALTADEIFLFYCQDKPPLLLIFDAQRRPNLLLFNADIAPFLKKVGIPAS
ncbi:hypothetical protein ACFO9Q_12550 [Paenibacillus sp. GCM10023252]|uniref:hypothetical protein n=1 Tax=Paenibacillus sp. GCM10023252 TaxID=3252649 RepID=UPI0036093C86